jgi:chromosome segregation ATPase
MSDDIKDVDSKKSDDQDPIKQLKGEFNRKHEKTNELLNQLVNTQAQLQEALSKLAKPAPKQEPIDDDIESLMYSDPKAYSQRIKEEAKREALEEMRRESSSQSSVNQTIAVLAGEYPELSDNDSDLTKKTVEILKTASEAEKMNARTYEYAVMKAAQQLDVKPRSKRPAAEEDFVAPSYTSPQSRSKKRSTEQVVTQNKDMAKAFGLNLDDPKVKERYLNLLKQKGSI